MTTADLTELEIPDRIRKAFAGRTYLNQTELADALEMNIKTVARHMDEGNLHYHEVGMGKVRPRRRSTLSQVCAFLLNQSRDGCESHKAPGRLRALPTRRFVDLVLAPPVQRSEAWRLDGRH